MYLNTPISLINSPTGGSALNPAIIMADPTSGELIRIFTGEGDPNITMAGVTGLTDRDYYDEASATTSYWGYDTLTSLWVLPVAGAGSALKIPLLTYTSPVFPDVHVPINVGGDIWESPFTVAFPSPLALPGPSWPVEFHPIVVYGQQTGIELARKSKMALDSTGVKGYRLDADQVLRITPSALDNMRSFTAPPYDDFITVKYVLG